VEKQVWYHHNNYETDY